jgi:hypothetical protein
MMTTFLANFPDFLNDEQGICLLYYLRRHTGKANFPDCLRIYEHYFLMLVWMPM